MGLNPAALQPSPAVGLHQTALGPNRSALGLNPTAPQLSPALTNIAAPQSASSSAHGPSSLTPPSAMTHPAASVSGAAEPHYGSSTSNVAPAHLSSEQLPGQLTGQGQARRGALMDSGQLASSSNAGDGPQSFGPANLLDTSVLADSDSTNPFTPVDNSISCL